MNPTAQTYARNPHPTIRVLAVLCAVVGLFAFAASPVGAKPRVDGKFAVSGVGTNNELTRGPDGNVWVTLDQTNDVARITPQGQVTEFDPVNLNHPTGITTGPDGQLWVTQSGGVASFSAADPDAAVKYAINDIGDARPIVAGPDGNMWTVSGDNVITFPTADPTSSTSYPVLVAGRDIDAGKDGKLWVADFGSQVVRVKTDGTAKAFDTGAGSGLQALATGPKGQVGYADPTSNPQRVGRIVKGKVTRTKTEGDPFGVAYGDDGAYWMPRFASSDLLRLTPHGKVSRLGGLGKNAGPRRIANGPRHTLWVTLDGAEEVAKVKGVK